MTVIELSTNLPICPVSVYCIHVDGIFHDFHLLQGKRVSIHFGW